LDLNLFNNIELTFACQRGFLFFAGPKIKKQKKGPKPAKLALALLLLLGRLLSSISLYAFLPAMPRPKPLEKLLLFAQTVPGFTRMEIRWCSQFSARCAGFPTFTFYISFNHSK